MKLIYRIFAALAIATGFFACETEQETPLDMGTNYFPAKIGNWYEYKIDSITYNDFYNPVKIDTFSYTVMLEVDTVITDLEGRETFILKKYVKTDTSSYKLIANHTLNITSSRVETQEDNIKYIKLIFPVKQGYKWDLNALNTNAATNSHYETVDEPSIVEGQVFDSVATIIHQDMNTLIGNEYHEERFARHIGLIYKKEINVVKNYSTGTYVNGYEYTMRLINRSL